MAFAGAINAQALLEAGDAPGALELLLASAGGDELPLLAGSWRAMYFELLTRCCLELGDDDQAAVAARRLRTQAGELGLKLPMLLADRAAASVALAQGAPHDAVDFALSAVERAEEIDAPVHAATSRALPVAPSSRAGARTRRSHSSCEPRRITTRSGRCATGIRWTHSSAHWATPSTVEAGPAGQVAPAWSC